MANPPSPGFLYGNVPVLYGGRAAVWMDTTNCGPSDGVYTVWTNTDEYCGYFVFSGSLAGAFYDALGLNILSLYARDGMGGQADQSIILSLPANQAPINVNYIENRWDPGTSSFTTVPVVALLDSTTSPLTIDTTSLPVNSNLTNFRLSRAF